MPASQQERSHKSYLSNRDKSLAKSKAWRLAHPEKAKQTYRKWFALHPEKAREHRRAGAHKWRAKNPGKNNAYERRYGITIADYDRMLAEQHGCCAICKKGNEARRFDVDHCHSTGVVRGLLCRNCNWGIGNLRDSAELVEVALEYLRKPRQREETKIIQYQAN